MDEETDETEYIIKHLVVSGGGTYGLAAYGALRELHQKGKWEIQNIKSCHGTSIGTGVLFIALLGYDWETIDTFLIDRPWKHVFKFDWSHFLDFYDNCGVFSIDHFKDSWSPLLLGANFTVDVTLKEFYEKTQVDFYIYAVEIDTFELTCFSHKTHPHVKLIDACYASCSIPVIFKPIAIDEKYYIDGGILLNYPVYQCLQQEGTHKNEILGIRKKIMSHQKIKMNQHTNLVEYLTLLMRNTMKNMKHFDKNIDLKNEICIEMEQMDFDALMYFIDCPENRKNIIQQGVDLAKKHIHD